MNDLAFSIGPDDHNELAHYPVAIGHEVRELVECFRRISAGSESGVVSAIRAEAARHFGQRGWSFPRLREKYYMFVRSGGDWRSLINRSKIPPPESKIPLETVEFWKARCGANQRKCKPAWKDIKAMWYAGKEIPGIGDWRTYWAGRGMRITQETVCPPQLPRGLTYSNLMRHKPDPAELALTRHGISYARAMLPHVIGTRQGMRPLEYIAFDDVELDFLVCVPGVQRPCKLKALVCKDVATDMWLRFVVRPAVPREDGCEDGLKLRDMKLLCADVMMHFGFPTDYASHWIVENATATISHGDIKALSDITGGMVQVHKTCMINGKVLVGGFSDKAVGNSWGKAWIESGFNLLHNTCAALPGQKGRRYDLAPAELEHRKRYAIDLIRSGQTLPADLRMQIRLPFQSIYEAPATLKQALMRINTSDTHDCEGFDGVTLYRLTESDPWKTYEQLPDLPPAMMEHLLTTVRKETRMERWARLVQGLTFQKMPDSLAPRWMDEHREVTVNKYQISLRHDGRDLVYFHRGSALLVEGAKYVAYFNPFDLDWVYLTDGKGAYKGKLPKVRSVARGDQEALAARLADTRSVLNDRLAAVRARNTDATEQALADMEHNAELFANASAIQVSPDITADQVAAIPAGIMDLHAEMNARNRESARDAKAGQIDLTKELLMEQQLHNKNEGV